MKIIMTVITVLFLATSSFAAEIRGKNVENFILDWFGAQNTGSYSKYAAMYSKHFVGIRRSGKSTRSFDHDTWLKDRKKMFKKKMLVSGSVPEIKLSGTTASVKFEQTWESYAYKDKGNKLIVLSLENGALKIIREEMLNSEVVSSTDENDSELSTVTTGTSPDGIGKYSSVKEKDCWSIKGYFDKHFDFTDNSKECPGFNGWHLFSISDSERSWLELGKGKRLWSAQNEITGSGEENSFGQVQDLGGLARVEWRLKPDGSPFALIFQVQATDPESTLEKVIILHRYYVIGLHGDAPLFCGMFKTKEEARKIADKRESCKALVERKINR